MPTVDSNTNLPRSIKVTIPDGAAVSEAIPLFHARRPRGIDFDMPAAWTAADLGVQTSRDGTTWKDRVLADGTRIKATTVAADTVIQGDAGLWGAGSQNYMRLESIDTADESAENQGADREIWVTFYE